MSSAMFVDAVADPLEVVRRDDDPRPALDVGRIGAHELDDLVEGRVVQPVDLVVLDGDLAGRDGVDVDERAQDAVDEDGAALGHLRQVDVVVRAAAPARA